MNENFSCRSVGDCTVIEFLNSDMTDLPTLEEMHAELGRSVESINPARLILDFEKVRYVSSKALVIVIDLAKKLGALPHGRLVLCSVPAKIVELLQTLHLHKILRIVATQQEAMAQPGQ